MLIIVRLKSGNFYVRVMKVIKCYVCHSRESGNLRYKGINLKQTGDSRFRGNDKRKTRVAS